MHIGAVHLLLGDAKIWLGGYIKLLVLCNLFCMAVN